jgi:hypothetical protein
MLNKNNQSDSDLDRVQLLQMKEPILIAKAKEQQGKRNDLNILANLPKSKKINVREDLAKEAGVSGHVYKALVAVNEKGSEDLKEAVREKKVLWSMLSPRDKVDAVLARVGYLVRGWYVLLMNKIFWRIGY